MKLSEPNCCLMSGRGQIGENLCHRQVLITHLHRRYSPLTSEVNSEIAHYGWEVIVEKSIDTILREHGIGTDAIGGIIWSHAHWDHISDLSLFPNDVPLIVGPGFKEEYFPGWPDDEEGDVNADAWQNGREVIELDFQRSSTVKIDGQSLSNKTKYHVAKSLAYASPCSIAEMGAFDVFLDGSFYLLDAPGHSPAHLCALARTGPSTEAKSEFVLLGGDAFDHGGALRPSKYCHLPAFILETANLSSQLLDRTRVASAGTSVHARPFLLPDAFDFDSAVRTLAKLAGLDARADVLTICAHEKLSEADGIPVFLKQLNGWRERNVREPLLWRFLNDFK